jgi:hypothetical protein
MCDKQGEWVIFYGKYPDDFTVSCTEHVGLLLTDSEEHVIYKADEADGQCCFVEEKK